MPRRRRRKTSRWITVPLWTGILVLAGWGLWQADTIRRAILQTRRQASPDVAVDAALVTPQGAQGGEPWKNAAPGATTAQSTAVDPATAAPLPLEKADARMESLLPGPTFDAALSPDELRARGMSLLSSGEMVAGRFALNAALARTTDDAGAADLRDLLHTLNQPIFLGSAVIPDDPAARMVDIQSGDTLLSIARTYGLTAAFLQSINPGINPNALKPLAGIKIVQGPFHARVIKHAHRLDLFARDLYVASFPVDFPDGNYLPRGDYEIAAGTKLQLPSRTGTKTWIGFQGLATARSLADSPGSQELDPQPNAAEEITSGWIYASAGPRGTSPRDRATAITLSDPDLEALFPLLSEARSHLRVEP